MLTTYICIHSNIIYTNKHHLYRPPTDICYTLYPTEVSIFIQTTVLCMYHITAYLLHNPSSYSLHSSIRKTKSTIRYIAYSIVIKCIHLHLYFVKCIYSSSIIQTEKFVISVYSQLYYTAQNFIHKVFFF